MRLPRNFNIWRKAVARNNSAVFNSNFHFDTLVQCSRIECLNSKHERKMALHSLLKSQKPARISKAEDDENVNETPMKKAKLGKERLEEKRIESEEVSVNRQGVTKQQNVPVPKVGLPVPRSSTDGFDWSVDNEVLFLTAMTGHKPVGVNRHFEMLCILDKFQASLNRDIDSQIVWDRLDTMYNMERLHEVESIPFPNDELEFTLPDEEFLDLMKEKPTPQEIDLLAEVVPPPPPPPETVAETKRELKRELQVYKGMKDIKKDKEITKPEPVPEIVKEPKEVKKEEKESPAAAPPPPSKRNRPSTPQDKRSSNIKDNKKDSKSTPTSTPKERRQSHSEKDTKSTPKSRTPSTKKEPAVKEEKSELRKDRVKELSTSGNSKRSTRGSITDSTSTKSASPITTGNLKRKRT